MSYKYMCIDCALGVEDCECISPVKFKQIFEAKKNDQGKPRISLIPASYIEGTANVFNFGAQKYGDHNYRMGLAHSRCLDASLRHILAILGGEATDPESLLPHVYHASCSLAMYDYMRINHPNLNDLFELKEKK